MSQGEPLIRKWEPKREWLLRCDDVDGGVGVCAIGVSNGSLEITGPDDMEPIRLERAHIAEFREALDFAVVQAEADLQRTQLAAAASR